MKYTFVVSRIELPEWCTGSISDEQSFEELDDAMALVDELNKDCDAEDYWYDVIVQANKTKE